MGLGDRPLDLKKNQCRTIGGLAASGTSPQAGKKRMDTLTQAERPIAVSMLLGKDMSLFQSMVVTEFNRDLPSYSDTDYDGNR